jgi:hypothetical protein
MIEKMAQLRKTEKTVRSEGGKKEIRRKEKAATQSASNEKWLPSGPTPNRLCSDYLLESPRSKNPWKDRCIV